MDRFDLEDLSVDTKMCVNKIKWQDWTGFRWLKQGQVARYFGYTNEYQCCINYGKFIEQL